MGGRSAMGRGPGRRSWWIGLAVLLAYVAWMLGPYFRSVVVRDAAVTAWIHVATSPIYGSVDRELPIPGQPVGLDGRILSVRNERADRGRLVAATAAVTRAEANVAELETRVAALRHLDADRQGLGERYATAFGRSLRIEVDGARRELGLITQRLALARALAGRKEALARGGNAAQSEADEAAAELAALELQRAERERTIALAELQQAAAGQGTFLLGDGTDPEWALRGRQALQLEVARTVGALAEAGASLDEARAAAEAEREVFGRASHGDVAVPPGSIVWSMIVGAGAAVDVGRPVAEWLDCAELLVDVPLADVEVALLREGMTADVVVEGERRVRQGTVLLTRGAAATLGGTDLAAVAKGRTPGVGQALLTLQATPEGAGGCPVGLGAFVDFPDLGLLDVLRARLRL